MDFQPGVRVQLKSGGPVMTADRFGTHPRTQEEGVWCTWFEKVGNRQERQTDHFNPVTLQKWEPPHPIRLRRA